MKWFCPWPVDHVTMDGENVPQAPGPCDAATPGWTQFEQNGDIIIELCGPTCTDYLAGNFKTLEASPFCEAA